MTDTLVVALVCRRTLRWQRSGSMREIAVPGGRLTQQERQQIALGLADGLAYAEIARRLDRPTSTITREVMRNGGPTAYRADLAHRATERRAHRRKHTPPRGQGVPAQAHGRDDEAVRERGGVHHPPD